MSICWPFHASGGTFARPYLFLSSYIITRKDYQKIKDRDDLKGKKISGARSVFNNNAYTGAAKVHPFFKGVPQVALCNFYTFG
jgi:ABC-type amino acid transport substrate-binding protein